MKHRFHPAAWAANRGVPRGNDQTEDHRAKRSRRGSGELFEPFPDFDPIRLPVSTGPVPVKIQRRTRPPVAPGTTRITAMLLVIGLLISAVFLLFLELRTQRVQARWLAEFAASIGFQVTEGAETETLPPDAGPYDIRLGYNRLPELTARLGASGFHITRQARLSPRSRALTERGLFQIYDEKIQAGLQVVDMQQRELYRARYPQNIYRSFDEIPTLVLQALTFIEDRELLDFTRPFQNPVVDWERLGKAVVLQTLKSTGLSNREIGASTLATQLEKLRHSPGGITHDAGDKLQQMISASLRVYRQGADTTAARRKLARDYLNSMPLAALSGYGEVTSLGDGLEAWYGSDFTEVNRVLNDPDAPLSTRALYFKQVLSLVLAVRRPSYYLGSDRAPLARLSDSYLRRMSSEQIITPELRDAALAASLEHRNRIFVPARTGYTQRKGINLIRNQLLTLAKVDSLYELDRFDLSVQTSLHGTVQAGVTEFLRALSSPDRIRELGLNGEKLINNADPQKINYSLVLYERGSQGNYLRVNADSLDLPFDINSGARLDLGSTAKLRTLVTWLELIAATHEQLNAAGQQPNSVPPAIHARDRLGNWVAEFMVANPGAGLQELLQAAMQRQFSASPATRFFTGGGSHQFANFDSADNNRILTVSEAFRRSVNLVFIRMMREIVDHHLYRAPTNLARVLEQGDEQQRELYLRRFAEKEGRQYMARFYRKYAGKSADAALQTLLEGLRPTPKSLTVILRSLQVVNSPAELAVWMKKYSPGAAPSEAEAASLYKRYNPAELDINDRGFLARLHPLELWLINYLRTHPGATLTETLATSTEVRQDVYGWLLKTSRRKLQDRRILDLLEIEAFQEVHQSWSRLGYPFASLTPSLAAAIGSSGDRPAALAELMGIIVAGGERIDNRTVEVVDIGVGTPYETRFELLPAQSVRVMRPEVAAVVRTALLDVVENGTARGLVPALRQPDGSHYSVGGKTGTGDHRFEVYSAPGRLLESRAVNRVATFVFMIDDRFFGTISAFVAGPEAAGYQFTSGLPVRLLGALMPTLAPLLERSAESGQDVNANTTTLETLAGKS